VFPELGSAWLTKQEKNCMVCAMKGLTIKQTAKELNLGYFTICMYRKNIIKKFNKLTIEKIVELIKKTDFIEKLGLE
jgi:DNA-binding CsgD family transcriptional regulator